MNLEQAVEIFQKRFLDHNFNWRFYPTRAMGLCPFHDDTRPSFNIYEMDGRFYYKCFACGKSGMVGKSGGEVPRGLKEVRDWLRIACQSALNNYKSTALIVKIGKPNLEDAIKFYRIGLITQDLISLTPPQLKKLFDEKLGGLEKYLGWFVFPYFSLTGHLVALKLRNVEENSRSSRVLKLVKKPVPCYFGGMGFLKDFIKQQDGWVYPCVITEGETDAISVYADSSIPALAVGSASNYRFLLKERLSQYNYFPLIFPDFDQPSLKSPGAGIEALFKLEELRRKEQVKEKIYCLVSREVYGGGKDVNDAIRSGIRVQDILKEGRIEELSTAVQDFKEEWTAYKRERYRKVADKLKEELPALAPVYPDFLGLEETPYEVNARDLLQMQVIQEEAILSRFPVRKISVISAFGGIGKTTWAMITALRIARDEGLKCLLWTTEHDENSLAERLRVVVALKEFWEEKGLELVSFRINRPEPFITLDGKELNKKAFFELEELLEKYDVLFLDPLLSFVGGEENDNTIIRQVFDAIHEILKKEKFQGKRKAVIFLHHFNKYALRDAKITEKDIQEEKDGQIYLKMEAVQKLEASVRGASAITDSARYVEALIKTDTARYCVTIKTNERTRKMGYGERIPELPKVDYDSQPIEEPQTEAETDYEDFESFDF